MTKTIVVCGATGQLGGSVARRMMLEGWIVRAITRNKDSHAAKLLTAKGAKLTNADYDDSASLVKAFEGAHAIFAATNFWEHITELGDQGAGEREYAQLLNIANAAQQTTTLEHLVLHALPAGEKLAGKDHIVPHWDYKDRAADEIKRSMPGLAAKTTFLWVGWFSSNFYTVALTKPVEIPQSGGAYVWIQPCKPSTCMWISEVDNNVGVYVAAVLKKPQVSLPAKYCIVTTDVIEYGDALKLWAEVLGRRAQYVECTPEEWEGLWGAIGVELRKQFKLNEVAEDWGSAHTGDVIGSAELGIRDQLLSLREALEREMLRRCKNRRGTSWTGGCLASQFDRCKYHDHD